MVGLTFAVIGFLACFFIGVPLAKYGIKKGLAKHVDSGKLDGFIKRGYYLKDEERTSMGKETVYSGNMDTMTLHFAIMGICFLIALGLAELVYYIPGIGPSFSGMLFIHGLVAAYIVKFIMKKLDVDHLLDNTFQSKITGWATDYLVVASFMAVQFSVIGEWAVPLLITSIIIILLTITVIMYFGKRFGGDDDFSRTLGLYGSALGTVPSGIALLRIIDPSLRSNTAVELGLMNVPMMLHLITASTILAIASGTMTMAAGILWLLAPIPAYMIVLKVFRVWGKKTYDFKGKEAYNKEIAVPTDRKDVI